MALAPVISLSLATVQKDLSRREAFIVYGIGLKGFDDSASSRTELFPMLHEDVSFSAVYGRCDLQPYLKFVRFQRISRRKF